MSKTPEQEETEMLDQIMMMQRNLRIKSQAREEFERNIYKKYFSLQLRNGQYGSPIITELNNQIKVMQDAELEKQDAKNPIGYFITLCPHPDLVLPQETFKLVKDMVSKVWIKNYVYSFEQRGITEEEIGKGVHSHIIVLRDGYRPSKADKELRYTAGKYGDTSIDKTVYYKSDPIYNRLELRNRVQYIVGEKKSTEHNHKDIKQFYDKPFRDRFGLKDYYEKGDIINEVIKSVS